MLKSIIRKFTKMLSYVKSIVDINVTHTYNMFVGFKMTNLSTNN